MKRYLYVLLFSVIFMVGCSNDNATNIDDNENLNERQEENKENETLEQEIQDENTYVDKDVVETPREINIGESAFITYPGGEFTEER